MSIGSADRGALERAREAPIFSYGFRLFFLAAAAYAAVAMLAWLTWIGLHALDVQIVRMSITMPTHLWHAHEMLFGYGLAVVAGFFLTAVPNWTGARPVRGGMLMVLGGLWLAARICVWLSAFLPAPLVAAFDLSFIGLLSVLVAQALISGWSRRNFIFLPTFATLFVASLLTHLENFGLADDTATVGQLLALDTLLVLIAVVGGRVVPAFTINALRNRGETSLPRAHDARDAVAIASVVLVLIVDLAAPGTWVSGFVALAAALFNGLRMWGWRSLRTLDQPILWVLHLGYAWLVLGFALKAAALLGAPITEIAAQHALMVGAVGTMTLGVMSRAALGHTGRDLVVSRSIVVAYALISVSALVRILGPTALPQFYNAAILLAGLLWALAFAIFTIVYWPILTRPRLAGQDH